MPKITFEPSGQVVDVKTGTSILDAAIAAGESGVACCGMHPPCGYWATDVLEGEAQLSTPGELEASFQKQKSYLPFRRLGCMAKVMGDVHVEVAR